MKKNVIAGLLAVSMLAGMPMSALAATEPSTTQLQMPEVQKTNPTTIESTHLDAFLKKYGWDKADGGKLTAKDFGKDEGDIYQFTTEADTIKKMSEEVQLRGITDTTASTLYIAEQYHKVGDYYYQVVYGVFMDVRTGLVNAAVAKRIPNNEFEGVSALYNMGKSTLKDIENDAKKFGDANLFKPSNAIAKRSTIYAYKTNTGYNGGLQSYWKTQGWNDSGKWTFYQDYAYPNKTPYLSAAEVSQAMKASANGGPQVAMIMPSVGFYFAERTYRIAGTQNRFFVDFVASGINPMADSDKMGANFSFLVVKPAKVNQDGNLDKYFYPSDTKMSTIVEDMKKIFSGSGAPSGAVN